MPSPFPGVDPFIESQGFDEFHVTFLVGLADVLVPKVRPGYVVRRQRRVYVERDPAVGRGIFPDVTIARDESHPSEEFDSGRGVSAGTLIEPVTLTLALVDEPREETVLTIQDRTTLDVVTVIELLSPANKRAGGCGRAAYLAKRDEVLRSPAHLVELDLLRGGLRLPTREALPPADFYAFVSRAPQRPHVDVYPWTLRHHLPKLPVPLKGDDEHVDVELQELYAQTYDRIGYDYSLDYSGPIEPPLPADGRQWVQSVLDQAATRKGPQR